jgi:hypothetical protein
VKQIGYLKASVTTEDLDKGNFSDEIVRGNSAKGEPDRSVRYLLKTVEPEDPMKNWEEFCARLERGNCSTHDTAKAGAFNIRSTGSVCSD